MSSPGRVVLECRWRIWLLSCAQRLVDDRMPVQLNLVPVLLGGGARLFDKLGADPTELEQLAVVPTTTVTHLRYRVLR